MWYSAGKPCDHHWWAFAYFKINWSYFTEINYLQMMTVSFNVDQTVNSKEVNKQWTCQSQSKCCWSLVLLWLLGPSSSTLVVNGDVPGNRSLVIQEKKRETGIYASHYMSFQAVPNLNSRHIIPWNVYQIQDQTLQFPILNDTWKLNSSTSRNMCFSLVFGQLSTKHIRFHHLGNLEKKHFTAFTFNIQTQYLKKMMSRVMDNKDYPADK